MLLKRIVCILSVLLVFFCNNVFAATKEDVISAINKTYTVGNEKFRLPQKIITKGENYLKKNKLSSTQYDNILGAIDRAVALAREVGTTDIKKVSKEDLRRGLQILSEASASANVDLNKELAESDINISEIVNSAPVTEPETPPTVEPETPDLPGNNETVNTETNNDNKTATDNAQKNDDKNIVSNVDKPNTNVENNAEKNDTNSSTTSTPSDVTGDNVSNVPMVDSTQDITTNTNKKGDISIEKILTIVITVLIVILFSFILIFYLIFRTKWNKILKYMLMIIFVILIIIVLVVLVGILYYIEEIKLIYKLYYMFN